jgi:hypothetical protein
MKPGRASDVPPMRELEARGHAALASMPVAAAIRSLDDL